MSMRPSCLLRVDERNRRLLARVRAGVKLLEVLSYVAAGLLAVAFSVAWPMGFAAL